MARRAKVWITGLALALAALWSAEAAHAGDKMRVCVVKISGTRDNNLKNDIVRLINQPYSVLKSSTFFKAATRMRIGKRLSPPNLRRLAKFLRLGAIIDGSLVAKSGRYKLVLKVRDGRTGAVVERIRHTLRGKNLSDNEKKRLRRDLISALERIRLDSAAGKSGAGSFGGDDDDDDDEEEDVKRTPPKRGDDVEVDDLDDDDDEDIEETTPKKSAKQLAAERRAEKRRKAQEAREARRKAAAEKRRKAKEAREARRQADADKRRKAREERERKRREAAEKRRKDREARIAARKAKAKKSDEEDDLEDDLEEDLEEDGDDLEDDEEDLDDEEESDEEGAKASATASAGDDDEEDDADDDPLLTKGAKTDAGPTGNPALVANAGLGAFARTLSFSSDSALMGTERPIDYEGSFVPSAFVELELYPLALTGGEGTTANIGIDATFEQALTLSSTVDPDGGSADNAFDVNTTYRRFGVGVRYRLALAGALIGLRVGYGQSAFELDKGAAMGMVDIPNTKYSYVDPGVTVHYPLGKLSIDGALRFLALLSAGEIQEPTSYGQASILAIDADAGVNYMVTAKIGVRLGVRLAQFNMSFTGTGDLSDRNNDDAQDVDSATDQYLGGYLTGSYRF